MMFSQRPARCLANRSAGDQPQRTFSAELSLNRAVVGFCWHGRVIDVQLDGDLRHATHRRGERPASAQRTCGIAAGNPRQDIVQHRLGQRHQPAGGLALGGCPLPAATSCKGHCLRRYARHGAPKANQRSVPDHVLWAIQGQGKAGIADGPALHWSSPRSSTCAPLSRLRAAMRSDTLTMVSTTRARGDTEPVRANLAMRSRALTNNQQSGFCCTGASRRQPGTRHLTREKRACADSLRLSYVS